MRPFASLTIQKKQVIFIKIIEHFVTVLKGTKYVHQSVVLYERLLPRNA